MTDELLDAVRELPKVMPHIEVPVQAGDDDVLLKHAARLYQRRLPPVDRAHPQRTCRTPRSPPTSSSASAARPRRNFRRTYDLLEELKLDIIHLAKYSTRPHTLAERDMVDDVPEAEKERRYHRAQRSARAR